MISTVTRYEIEAGKPRLFSFRFSDKAHTVDQDELAIWFWDGYLLIADWLNDTHFTPDFYELPKVQEFLVCFAQLAKDAVHRTLDEEMIYEYLRLCEDTWDAILEHYHRPR